MTWRGSGIVPRAVQLSTYLTFVSLRALADVDNGGKLNLAEFHVAMGLIYRSAFSTASVSSPL
jgi:hypothetical protein